jgi:hypothetical protein
MKFLFWNIKKNPIGPILSQIAAEHRVDVVILAECPDHGSILQDLNSRTENQFHLTDSKRTRVVIYTRFPGEFTQPEYHDDILTVRNIRLPGRKDILLAAAHLPSKLYPSAGNQEINQAFIASRVSEEIRRIESKVGHSRTVLVGDLNMSPFEAGMISAGGLHAVMTKDIAIKKSRTVQQRAYPFFYNPMWGRFGDTTKGPPGTYYHSRTTYLEYFWHMFDQVLTRPGLIGSFESETLQVLTECGGSTFLRESGVPDATRIIRSPSASICAKALKTGG